MKSVFLAVAAVAAGFAFAEDVKAAPKKAELPKEAREEVAPPVVKEQGEPLFWGFGNYGIYSGYQLYGSLLNSEPTMQGYLEANLNLSWNQWAFGYLGIGVWSNTDLTDKRRDLYGKAFNEWDPNIHWGYTLWFDDDQKWGLDYRTTFVWYYYPHGRGHDHNTHGKSHFQYGHDTMTTMDWDHYFEFKNPYLNPFVNWVHEYHENKANLWEMGVKRTFKFKSIDKLSITPLMVWTYRSHRYNWCFPTAGWTELHGSGFATTKLGVDAEYEITPNIGIFAKVYWCHVYDHSLRAAAEHGSGGDYGQYKDFAWGGVGISVKF